MMYDADGNKTWEAQLDIYGRVRTFAGRSLNRCNWRYQGQYFDAETGLGYNRFRYIDYDTGSYISQNPIRLAGGNPTIYGYVHDPNSWVDIFGLAVDDFNQAMNKALGWLGERGFRAETPTLGRFGDIKGKPIGMQTIDGKTGFRVEYDARSGAHINVWSGKEKGPHYEFEASEKTVKKIQKRYH